MLFSMISGPIIPYLILNVGHCLQRVFNTLGRENKKLIDLKAKMERISRRL